MTLSSSGDHHTPSSLPTLCHTMSLWLMPVSPRHHHHHHYDYERRPYGHQWGRSTCQHLIVHDLNTSNNYKNDDERDLRHRRLRRICISSGLVFFFSFQVIIIPFFTPLTNVSNRLWVWPPQEQWNPRPPSPTATTMMTGTRDTSAPWAVGIFFFTTLLTIISQ